MLMNYLAILVAAIAGMVVGFLWYGPVFGKIWIKLSGFTPEQMAAAQARGMKKEYLLSFLGLLITAGVLEKVISTISLNMKGTLMFVLMGWLAFLVPSFLNSVLWEGKSWKLYFLNIAERLVTFSVIAEILVLFR